MKSGIKIPIIMDQTFGFGSRFEFVEAQITPRTVFSHIKYHRSGCTFAKATKELLTEMIEINELADNLQKRAREFREKLKLAPKGDEAAGPS